ncbi:MAG: LemA family protein [Bacteroidetes bacterium]|nr:LemA family protein [Bacteroidota bacterium]
MKKAWIIVLLVIAALALWLKSSYNGLLPLDENVKEKWANVQAQYKRRAELIPNLVETVKGAANFETKTLTEVMEARAKATQMVIDPTNLTVEKMKEFQAAQGQLSMAMGRLMAVSENYPQLKANQNFLDLQAELSGTGNRITAAIKDYNESVKEYNISVRRFPVNMLAGMFNMSARPAFEADPEAQKNPKVSF